MSLQSPRQAERDTVTMEDHGVASIFFQHLLDKYNQTLPHTFKIEAIFLGESSGSFRDSVSPVTDSIRVHSENRGRRLALLESRHERETSRLTPY